jgi:phosphinothricin acetyltransferase
VIEHSIYMRPEAQGRGIEAALLNALIGTAEAVCLWTIQTCIFPENTTSLRLCVPRISSTALTSRVALTSVRA